MHLSKAEISAATSSISSNVKNDRRYMAVSQPLSAYYDINGQSHSLLDDEACYARSIQGLGGAKHQIIVNLKDEVFLKDDDFYLTDSQRMAKLNGLANKPYKFVTVTKATLVEYVNYLRTGSLISLRKSQSGI